MCTCARVRRTRRSTCDRRGQAGTQQMGHVLGARAPDGGGDGWQQVDPTHSSAGSAGHCSCSPQWRCSRRSSTSRARITTREPSLSITFPSIELSKAANRSSSRSGEGVLFTCTPGKHLSADAPVSELNARTTCHTNNHRTRYIYAFLCLLPIALVEGSRPFQ